VEESVVPLHNIEKKKMTYEYACGGEPEKFTIANA
jgi:hypothetical protein